jgi:RNA 2',3'-cyclic 3'-phosphodiesterase
MNQVDPRASWRLFVAILPSEEAAADLDASLVALREAWPGLRWTPPAMWHLTAAFFGEVLVDRVPELSARLERAATRHEALALRFAGGGGFARPARASVVYAGVAGSLPQLQALADSCAATGRRIGLAMEDRPYRPHLTLARVRGRAPVDVRTIVDQLDGYEGPTWTSSEIVLMRSHLGSQPRHEPIGRWPLRGADSHDRENKSDPMAH